MGKSIFFREILKQAVSQVPLDQTEQDELPAAVSHWIQSPDIKYPYLYSSVLQGLASQITNSSSVNNDFLIKEPLQNYHPQLSLFLDQLPYPPPKKWDFTFIDLFAGIGGFRIAFQKAGGKCIFSSEWDKYAKQTYNANFGEIPYGDIRRINKNEIPDHDILCAGFPCQPFSLAGVSKKNSMGRKHGFEDDTQGTLFYEIKEILRIKRPKAFMLENVKNLMSHDKGKTFEIIRHSLVDQLGYTVNWKIVDGAKWVPQHRERLFIVGYDPKQIQVEKEEISIPDKPSEDYVYPALSRIINPKIKGFTLGPGTWATLERHKAHHSRIGNGFGYGIHQMPLRKDEVTRTISARYHKDGAEILIAQQGDRPRRLTIQEAMQLQGYDPDRFHFPVSNTQAYKQIGNSVVVPAVSECALEIAKMIKNRNQKKH